MGATTESLDTPQPAADDEPFAPPAELSEPTIEMGSAKVGQPVELSALVENAADPTDYVWRITGDPRGDVVLTGQRVTFTPLAPVDHRVSVEVHDAYDRTTSASVTMPVALA